ncbi:MAG: hypothetical protein A3H35_11935 [Betaproteobacteria bacterium RIFCSPLOWO2_02_FULL_62_17]|nr:MAG: hypothetical protein A3H35_11935 [Betaproteobacteria bacterium RIFCSPLOWO2_02_FULL_62_17]
MERRQIPGFWIKFQIMQGQYFWQVCKVILAYAFIKIVNQVFHRCYGSSVIKSSVFVRQQHRQRAFIFQYAYPLGQSQDRVRGMLKNV